MNDSTRRHDEAPGKRPVLAIMFVRVAVVLALAVTAFLALDNRWPAEFDAKRIAAAIAAAFVLMLGTMLVVGWRLAVLASDCVRPLDGIAVNLVAQLVVLLVPSRLSEAAKPLGLNLRCGLPVATGFAVLVVERLLDTIFLAVLALGSVAVAAGPYAGSLRSSATTLVGLGLVGATCLLLIIWRPGLLIKVAIMTRSQWIERQTWQIVNALSRLAAPGVAALAIGLSALSWLLSYMIFFVVIEIMDIGRLDAGTILVVFVASTLGLVISIAPGGLGTFEGAIVLALSAFGVPVAAAVATALLLRLCLALPVLVGGSWVLTASGESLWTLMRRLKQPGAGR